MEVSLIYPKASSPDVLKALSWQSYTWAVLTSANGVEQLFASLKQSHVDLRRLLHLRFAAIGNGTAQALEEHGIFVDCVPEHFDSRSLAEALIPQLTMQDRVLLLRAENGSVILPQLLEQAGKAVDTVPLYRVQTDLRKRELLLQELADTDYDFSCQCFRSTCLCRNDGGNRNCGEADLYRKCYHKGSGNGRTFCGGNCGTVGYSRHDRMHSERKRGVEYGSFALHLHGEKVHRVRCGKSGTAACLGLAGNLVREVTVAAPEPMPACWKTQSWTYLQQPYAPELLGENLLVFAATDDSAENARIVREAQAAGKLASSATVSPDCTPDFAVPAHRKHGDITMAVTTEGDAPSLAGAICRELEPKLAEYSELCTCLGILRRAWKETMPDEIRRMQLLRILTEPKALELFREKGKGAYLAYASSLTEEQLPACRNALLMVSFGTSYADTREQTIGAVESAVKQAFPEMDVFRAFTERHDHSEDAAAGHCGRHGAGGTGEAETERVYPCVHSADSRYSRRGVRPPLCRCGIVCRSLCGVPHRQTAADRNGRLSGTDSGNGAGRRNRKGIDQGISVNGTRHAAHHQSGVSGI